MKTDTTVFELIEKEHQRNRTYRVGEFCER